MSAIKQGERRQHDDTASAPKRRKTQDSYPASGEDGPNGPANSVAAVSSSDMAGDSVDVYVDVSCFGNVNVRNRAQPAGWGVYVAGARAVELYGPVITDPAHPFFSGAEVPNRMIRLQQYGRVDGPPRVSPLAQLQGF